MNFISNHVDTGSENEITAAKDAILRMVSNSSRGRRQE